MNIISKKIINVTLLMWFGFSVFSMLLWAFAGIPIWSQIDEQYTRSFVLTIFYIGGFFVPVMYWSLTYEQS